MKKHHILFSIIYLIATYLLFLVGLNKISSLHFSYDLLFIFTLCDVFILLHFILDIKKMYDFIYHKRYLLGFILLAMLVILKYNGSSISLWNNYVEPQYKVNDSIILGVPRPIRSDEWLVTTPLVLTQRYTNFSSYNDIISASNNLVMLQPNLPSKDISILATPHNIGYLFLDIERAFSLSWFLPYFLLFFATFEMFMILTKKKKLYSLVGAILITLSPVVGWWQNTGIVGYGALAIVLFYYFLNTDNWKKKLLLSILIGYVGFLYIMFLYPAWQVPYGYCYLILLIYLLIDNKDKLKWSNLLYLLPVIIVTVIPLFTILIKNKEVFDIISNTVYPGKRLSVGGGEWRLLLSYVVDILFPFIEVGNPCELSEYISLYPLPTIYAIYLIFRDKKIDWLLILSSFLILIFSLWVMFPWPSILSKVTMLSMSTEGRICPPIGYISVIQLIYIMANYNKKKNITFKQNIVLFSISMLISLILVRTSDIVVKNLVNCDINIKLLFICFALFSFVIFMFLLNDEKHNKYLCILFILISIIGCIFIAPLNKGLSILYNKPISNEIKKIISINKDAIFMVTDSDFVLPNYIAANGGKTINTTNYIPNLPLYKKLDSEGLYEDVYNRYEHVTVNLTSEKTFFTLNYQDSITINLNYNDICKTGANYLITNSVDEKYNKYNKIYGKYGTYIYKTEC